MTPGSGARGCPPTSYSPLCGGRPPPNEIPRCPTCKVQRNFDKRKVELGSCGRPYGTPCQHEHACIRCPVLHVSPKMLARLEEMEEDLLARRDRAEAEHWLGEVEGINITLNFLRAKREDTRRRTQRPAVDLGIPVTRPGRETR